MFGVVPPPIIRSAYNCIYRIWYLSHLIFIFGNCSTCFGWYLHPSSGAHTTVSTASGICHTVYLYLETALHVSGGTFTHHQERIQLYLQHMVFVTPYTYIWKLLYMFRVVPPPIIRSAYNCIYSIWYLSHLIFISGNCSTCFGWYLHPSSGAHTTVSTASGICHTVYLYLETALHVWGSTSTHHQERIQLYLQHLVFVTPYIYIWKLLYMFRVVPPPIIRSAYNCIYSIWYLSHRIFISENCSTCFGWYLHPSSGAHTTVSTASGICHTVYLYL